ncbi:MULTISPECIES: thermonuclease family protein [Enterococcus]|uniref:thermonuclease family protein n=1 Tax=Enterococcus TaxID=1350 RepID=UPI00249E6CBD|nr:MULTISPECIES: thermonuclease family protein [Enterococcus]MDT2740412.1 thermonuclease family protein [Enterococcus canintestini]WHA08111.1 thermonuclease family protein [Enterococcus montenegrensis]
MKKKISLGSILIVLLLFFLQVTGILPNTEKKQSQADVPHNTTTTTKHVAIEAVDLDNPPRLEKITVLRIRNVDGDTFAFYVHDKEYKLRLLMVDTPESVKPNLAVQPFGKEASAFTKDKLANGDISIVFDKGEIKDSYGRYLAYVYVKDEMLQTALLKAGLGIVRYVNAGGDSYVNELLAAQKSAQSMQLGVWQEKNYVVKKSNGYYQYNER